MAAGMDDYLSKPFEIAMLREKLARWMPDDREQDASVGITEKT